MRIPPWASRLYCYLFATKKRTAATLSLSLLVLLLLIVAGGYWYVTSGGLIARQDPSSLEMFLARHLVDLSIPNDVKLRTNPLTAAMHGGDMAAGRELYQKNCEVCHGYDGSGRTASGGGLYPRPPALAGPMAAKRTDGSLFYLIRNGIRNTGMPGWQLPDQQTWQLVLFVRHLPAVASATPPIAASPPAGAQYVGSTMCASCHQTIYNRWIKTLMANVVRDPRQHPDAILPDLSKADPLLTFSIADISFVYGSKWKQRYFKKVGDDYFPLPAQWDVTHKKWKAYFVKDDWWTPFYEPDNAKRPTGPTCDGCHSVNYNISTKTVTEWNVGCEKCHGPGGEHLHNPISATILNPARLQYVQANDTCIQCHSQGRPTTNPVNGKTYDWPVGFHMGKTLADFWKLEPHQPGQTTFTHFAEGTAHKNRMQGNDFVKSAMYTHGVTCFTCHDSHGTEYESLLRKPADTLCLDCHGPHSPNGPRAPTLEAHTHHKSASPGGQCIACHMPKIAQTLGDVNVRSHTFRFINPAQSESMKVPNACNVCHADQSTAWATAALKKWTDQSPWRVTE
jgi:predicted CXXCH cytochrome family protein